MYKDPHTDHTDNWIEKAIYNTLAFLDANYSDGQISIELLNLGVAAESLSLILCAAKILHKDEQENYLGD